MRIVETPLDKLSNRAADAIEAGHYNQAEQLCKKLLRLHRKAFDGHDRMAMLRDSSTIEPQGRFQEAARHYSKLLEMIEKDPTGTDHETVQYITEKRDRALAQVKE